MKWNFTRNSRSKNMFCFLTFKNREFSHTILNAQKEQKEKET